MYYIYKITNKLNNKVYIGKSSTQVKDRWQTHLSIAKAGKNKYPRLFFAIHYAISRYGENNFVFEIIKYCASEAEAFLEEQLKIKEFKINGIKLYNLTNGGDGPTGAKRSKISKKKMSLAHQKPGYKTARQKLNIEQVIQIKLMLTDNKIKMKEIADMFSVNLQAISQINRSKTWSWVLVPSFTPAKRIPNRKLSEQQVLEIKTKLVEKISYRKIADAYGVSVATIQNIANNKIFKDIVLPSYSKHHFQ